MLADTRVVSNLQNSTAPSYLPGCTDPRRNIVHKMARAVKSASSHYTYSYTGALGAADQRTVRAAIREACKEQS